MIVVADASPLNYLILIGHVEVFNRCTGVSSCPQGVLNDAAGRGLNP